MAAHAYKARFHIITAIRFRRGVSTRAELLAFCPGLDIPGDRDLPTVIAMQSPAGMTTLADGDYLVCRGGVHYRWDADGFENEYEEAS